MHTNETQLTASPAVQATAKEARTLQELSPAQWKSGIAAWLGWLFDGLDMHIYTLVATAFVAILLNGHDFHSQFNATDINQDGRITAVEWTAAQPLAQTDRDGDGAISRDEFDVFAARNHTGDESTKAVVKTGRWVLSRSANPQPL